MNAYALTVGLWEEKARESVDVSVIAERVTAVVASAGTWPWLGRGDTRVTGPAWAIWWAVPGVRETVRTGVVYRDAGMARDVVRWATGRE